MVFENTEGIPYTVEGDNLIFAYKGTKISLNVPSNVLIGEYPSGSERIGDTQGIDFHTPDFGINASIEYSYSKTQEHYQKQRREGY